MITRTDIQLDAVVIPRSLFQDKSFNQGKVNDLFAFIDLIQMATLEEKIVTIKGIPVKLERGEIATSTRILAERWGWSVNATTNALLRYEKHGRVIRRKSNLTSIISITNFDQFVVYPNADEYTERYADGYAEGISSHAHDELNIFNNNINKPSFQSESDKSKAGDVEEDSLFPNVEKEKKKIPQKKKSSDEDVEKLYSLYPAKCPVRDSYTHKSEKCKAKIKSLLTKHKAEELEAIMRRYVEETYGKHYLKDFMSFLNNLPDYSDAPSGPKKEIPSWAKEGERYSLSFFMDHERELHIIGEDLRKHVLRGGAIEWVDGDWTKIG